MKSVLQLQSHMQGYRSYRPTADPRAIASVVEIMVEALTNGKKLLVMGNGGSAADAQHMAAEIVGRFKIGTAWASGYCPDHRHFNSHAIGNDYGFDMVFRRQVEALADKGDVVMGISTSGSFPKCPEGSASGRRDGVQDCRSSGEGWRDHQGLR